MTVELPVDLTTLSDEEFKEFVEKFDVFFSDCDGVIWSFLTPYPGSVETLNTLKSLNKRVYLLTNNSQLNRESMVEKCSKMDIKLSVEDMLTSTYVAAQYLKQIGFSETVYVLGPEILGKELDLAGIKHIGIGPDECVGTFYEHILNRYKLDSSVGAVLVAFDGNFSMIKLAKAVNYLKNENIKFYATNADSCFNIPQFNFLLPEVGTLVNAITAATKRKPEIILKPSTHVCKVLAESAPPIDSSRAIMIGDTITTDMIFGRSAGYKTLLVGTGVSSMKDVEEVVEKINKGEGSEELKKQVPDYFIPSLDAFYKRLSKVF